jgi:hypothetical protein
MHRYIKPVLSTTPGPQTGDHPGKSYENAAVPTIGDLTFDLCRIICLVRFINATTRSAVMTPKAEEKTPYCFDFYDWIYAYQKFKDDGSTGMGLYASVYDEWTKFFDLFPDLFGSFLVRSSYSGTCTVSSCSHSQSSVGNVFPYFELYDSKTGNRNMETFVQSAISSTVTDIDCDKCGTKGNGNVNASYLHQLSKNIAFRLPPNTTILPQHDGEKQTAYEERLEASNDSMAMDKIPTFLVFGDNFLHLQSVIEYIPGHYTAKLMTKSNSRLHVLCNDKSTKAVKLSNTSEDSTTSPTFIHDSHAEMAIYECLTHEKFSELLSVAFNSAESFPSTPPATTKRNASSAISVSATSKGENKKQKTIKEPTATEVLGIFFGVHARQYPIVAKIIFNKAIQSMISFIMSKPGSNSSTPRSIEFCNTSNQGYRISLEGIDKSKTGVITMSFLLFVKTNYREKPTLENPGKYLDFSFYCSSNLEWDWNMGITRDDVIRKYGGSSNTHYDSIEKDPNLKTLTDEGILHTFDLVLSVLSGTIVFHNYFDSSLKLLFFG